MLRYRMLLFKMSRLVSKNKLSGVEAITFAGQFSELMASQEDVERLVADLFDHENPQVRRIGLNAIRRARQFGGPALLPALLRRLSDPEPWLRHDAVWVVQEGGLDGAELRAALRRLAGSVQLPHDAVRARANPTDAPLHAQVRARQALDTLIIKSAAEQNAALAAGGQLGAVAEQQPYASGTIGHIGLAHRALQRRLAGRKLHSSAKLTFRRVEPVEGAGGKTGKTRYLR